MKGATKLGASPLERLARELKNMSSAMELSLAEWQHYRDAAHRAGRIVEELARAREPGDVIGLVGMCHAIADGCLD